MSALIEFLDLLSENWIYAFTNGMIQNIFPGESEEDLKKTLSRAVSDRVIERACRGTNVFDNQFFRIAIFPHTDMIARSES